ncbi:MAG: hypothetical protein GY769_26045 [bacterium]|nr:hypothetical protein [bacterium]
MRTAAWVCLGMVAAAGFLTTPATSQEIPSFEITAFVEGRLFRFEPRLPVIPRWCEFTVTANISSSDFARFTLSDFETLQFVPSGPGSWEPPPKGPEVLIVTEGGADPVREAIEFANGDTVTFRLEASDQGERQMLAFTVTLFDADGEAMAAFVDPWDIQP